MELQRVSTGRNVLAFALFSAGIAAIGGCGSDASSNAPHPSAQLSSKNDPPAPPPRPQTKEECDACGGLWAIHGLVPAESCICLTSDGGERCFDGRDCEGMCLVNRDVAFQVMGENDPPRGFFTGRCAAYDTTFGCHWIIPTDIEALLPLPADEAANQICVD